MSVHELDVAWRLVLALGLSSVVGLEREIRHKSAGLRTHALVGLGAALFMLVSTYGFADVLSKHVTVDPSRVAAQIVSGIGFIGGGLIFVRRADVRGLTTAASVWTVAAIGMAAGGDLPILGALTTAMYLVISLVYPFLTERLPTVRSAATIRLTYLDGRGLLRQLLAACADHGFAVADLEVEAADDGHGREVTIRLELRGRSSLSELIDDLGAVDGVSDVAVLGRGETARRQQGKPHQGLRDASRVTRSGSPLARN
jgi:putative Mg2+ transporter-C (MgtC) family protein